MQKIKTSPKQLNGFGRLLMKDNNGCCLSYKLTLAFSSGVLKKLYGKRIKHGWYQWRSNVNADNEGSAGIIVQFAVFYWLAKH